MSQMISFSKMHGLGNDFMVIDATARAFDLTVPEIRRLADRHTGVGFDQLLVVEPPQGDRALFRYRIFNADGGEVEQCGNGARCFAVFVREQGLTDADRIPVETAGGLITLRVRADGQVSVDMGVPDFRPEALPFIADEAVTNPAGGGAWRLPLAGDNIDFDTVSMGNPHAVILCDDLERADVAGIGAALGADGHFPKGVNAGFMQIIDRGHIRLRVFERGAGETRACGTGACAAVAVGIRRQLLDNRVRVDLRGGTLDIDWPGESQEGEGQPLIMTGPACSVYRGQIDREQIRQCESQSERTDN